MTGMTPGFPTAARAQTLGAWFAQTVTGRGLIAVLAVLSQLGFQLLDPLLQLFQSLLQGQDNLDQRFGLAPGQRQKFFTREHGTVAFGSWPGVDRPKYPSLVLGFAAPDPGGCVPGSGRRRSSWRRDNNHPGTAPARQRFPAALPDGRIAPANRWPGAGPPGPKCGWPTPAHVPHARSKTDCCSLPGPSGLGAHWLSSQGKYLAAGSSKPRR